MRIWRRSIPDFRHQGIPMLSTRGTNIMNRNGQAERMAGYHQVATVKSFHYTSTKELRQQSAIG